jgi:hypothetical protein
MSKGNLHFITVPECCGQGFPVEALRAWNNIARRIRHADTKATSLRPSTVKSSSKASPSEPFSHAVILNPERSGAPYGFT